MNAALVSNLKQTVGQVIMQLEAAVDAESIDRRAFTRVLALLWAAQGELGLVLPTADMLARARLGAVSGVIT